MQNQDHIFEVTLFHIWIAAMIVLIIVTLAFVVGVGVGEKKTSISQFRRTQQGEIHERTDKTLPVEKPRLHTPDADGMTESLKVEDKKAQYEVPTNEPVEGSESGEIYINITIAAHSLHPTVVEPGATLTIRYTLDTLKPIKVALACSIQEAGTLIWINDLDNSEVVDIAVGSGSYSRKFILPSTLKPGRYDVAWGIWDPGLAVPYDGKLSRDALTVMAPTVIEDTMEDAGAVDVYTSPENETP